MTDRLITVTAAFTVRVSTPETAKTLIAKWTEGMPRCERFDIVSVESARPTIDRDDNHPVTEADLLNGYGAHIDEMPRSQPTPGKLGHIATPWPQ